jgi:hypothetical protein
VRLYRRKLAIRRVWCESFAPEIWRMGRIARRLLLYHNNPEVVIYGAKHDSIDYRGLQ